MARALDCGAQGIIFPRMEDPKLLETALSWTKFPPAGVRGYGLQPSQTAYSGLSFNEIIAHLNANTLTVLQIESRRAVEAREEILSVPGIEAMEAVRDNCERRGIAPGTHTRNIGLAKFWKERGMRFLGCGGDIGYLWEKAAETAKAVLD